MLTFALFAAVIAMCVAGVALARARRAAKRADRLAESYWELRYEIGQLKGRIHRLDISVGLAEASPDAEPATPRPASTTSFVPLSSLKK